MNGTATVILIAIVLLVLIAAVVLISRWNKRPDREELRDRFGPEYDRAVDEHGGEKAADKRLADVAKRRDTLEIRDLEPAERDQHAQQWAGVQTAFVNDPAAATRDADRLVGSVMRDRGYPVDDFETKADMLAAEDPQVTEHYRAAHAVGVRSAEASTEELRQAFVHYRALFEVLLEPGSRGGPGSDDVDLRSVEQTRTDTPRP